ncbi:MAG: Zn-ribbon domain-containing OB-fold protein [Candidatus Bathyarchaeota archaeon]|nr:MAG: Zn-ribbon domain-containing OB-fold protein [Candidatus Bathyarchaeota archaeon]
MFISWPAIKSRPYTMEFEIPMSKTKKFWDGIEIGEIRTTRCKKCGATHFPPVADCPDCGSSSMEWIKLSGRGEIEAFTHVIARPTSFQNREPYTIVIGRLVDGVKVLAWLREAEITDVEVGVKVKLTVGTTVEGETTYWFVPA